MGSRLELEATKPDLNLTNPPKTHSAIWYVPFQLDGSRAHMLPSQFTTKPADADSAL